MKKETKNQVYFNEKEVEVMEIHDSLVELLYKPKMKLSDTELLYMGIELFSRTLAKLLDNGDKDVKCINRVDKLESKIYALEQLNEKIHNQEANS